MATTRLNSINSNGVALSINNLSGQNIVLGGGGGNTSISNNLAVSGSTVLASVTSTSLTATSLVSTSISVSGLSEFSGGITIPIGIPSVLGDTNIKAITGTSATFSSTLSVEGATTLAGISSSGTNTISSINTTTLNSSGLASLASLNITGSSSLQSLTTTTLSGTSATLSSTLGVTGAATFGTAGISVSGASTLAVVSATSLTSGTAVFSSTLGVSGLLSAATLSVSGNTVLTGTTTSTLNVNGNLIVSGNSSAVNSTVSGTLSVSGNTTIQQLSAVNSTFSGRMSITSDSSGGLPSLTTAGDISTSGKVKYIGSNSKFTALKAPASSNDITLTLPENLPTISNSYIISDTLGNLSYSASTTPFPVFNFSGVQNAVAADIVGLSYVSGTIDLGISVTIIATNSISQLFRLSGILSGGSGWNFTTIRVSGDDTLVSFSITSTGQVKYSSGSYPGFSSLSFSWSILTPNVSASNLVSGVNSVGQVVNSGTFFNVNNSIFLDSITVSGGTQPVFNSSFFGSSSISATNTGVITTNASTVYIEGPVLAGTNEVLTNSYSLNVASGTSIFQGPLRATNGFTSTSTTTLAGLTATTITGSSLGISGVSTLGTLTVTGTTTLGTTSIGTTTLGTTTITGNASVSGTMTITGNESVSGTMTITGNTSLQSTTISSLSSGSISVSGTSNLGTLVAGSGSLTSLSVSGNSSISILNINGSVSGVVSLKASTGTFDLNLPVSLGTSGQALISGGTGAPLSWVNLTTGTVTSVAVSVPSFLTVSGSPITSSGTIALTYSGTAIPVTSGGTGTTTSTGTGSVVLNTSPSLITPVLGAASGTSLSLTGQLTSTLATGTAPFVVSSTTLVSNLNANFLSGATFATPGVIGGTTASSASFTSVNLTSTTASTSATTGALTVAGGLGVSGTTNISVPSNVGLSVENLNSIGSQTNLAYYLAPNTVGNSIVYIGHDLGTNYNYSYSGFNFTTSLNVNNHGFMGIGLTSLLPSLRYYSNGTVSSSSTTGTLVVSGGLGVSGSIFSDTLHSVVSTGTAPITVASTTLVSNLNANFLSGATFGSPGAIGGTTPGSASFTNTQVSGTLSNIGNTTISGTLSVSGLSNLTTLSVSSTSTFTSGSFTSVQLSGILNMNSNRITGLSAPISSTDAVNKGYVDLAIQGLSTKESAVAATIEPGTFATSFQNGSVIDSVTLATGNRILVKNQTNSVENGIYIVNATGAPTRTSDFAAGTSQAGSYIFITRGTVNGDNGFVCISDPPNDIPGTSPINFTQFSSSGNVIAGTGLTRVGNVLSVNSSQTQITQVGTLLSLSTSGAIVVGSTLNVSGLSTLPTLNSTVIGINGSTSGVVSFKASSGTFDLNLPTSLGTMGQALISGGVGNPLSWTTFVSSVAVSVPSFLTVSGSPITSSGTIALTYSGVAIPVSSGGTGTTTSTGTGSVVLNTSPSLITPVLGAASGTSLSLTGQFTSTLATGTAPFVVASATLVSNLNSNFLSGATFASPGTIGGTTAGIASFTTVNINGSTSGVVSIKASTGTLDLNLPVSLGTSGQALISGGVGNPLSWATFVSSVAVSVPSFLTVSGSPIISSGTIALTYSGTAIPVTSGGTGTTTSTGTGSVVLNTSPSLITPVLGAASGTSLSLTAQLTSTLATGTAPFVVSSTTLVSNLNSNFLSGATFASPGVIGGTTASSASFTSVNLTSTTASTSATTGALTVAGGLGVSGTVNISVPSNVGLSVENLNSIGSQTNLAYYLAPNTTGNSIVYIGHDLGTNYNYSYSGFNFTTSLNVNNHGFMGIGLTSLLPSLRYYSNGTVSSSSTTGTLVVAGGLGVSGSIFSDTLHSVVSTGTAPITVVSTTLVSNLNANFLSGATFGSPGAIGGTTAGIASFTNTTLNILNVSGSTSGAISLKASTGTFDFNLPVSLGTAGQALISGGTGNPLSWVNLTTGTVTSVAVSVPSFLTVSGSPITSSGTIALTYSGVAIPVSSGGTGTTTSTGSGSVVLNTSPSLITPVLGVASGTSLSLTGQLTSTLATGTAPFVVSSTTLVSNLNANFLSGATFASPGAIGGTTASTGTFTTISCSTATVSGNLGVSTNLTVNGTTTLGVASSGSLTVSGQTSSGSLTVSGTSSLGVVSSLALSATSGSFTSILNMNSNKITNLATPTQNTDASNKGYTDSLVNSQNSKNTVIASTTLSGTLATSFQNGSVIDSVTLATGNRILIKNQASAIENGVYIVNSTGTPTRTLDFSTGSSVSGSFVFVLSGTVNTLLGFIVSNLPGSDVVGTNNLTFTRMTSGGLVPGVGLEVVSFQLNVVPIQTQITRVGTLTSLSVSGSTTTESLIVAGNSLIPNSSDIFTQVSFSGSQTITNGNVAGLLASFTTTRSFIIQMSVVVIATSSLYAQFEIKGIQSSSGVWYLVQNSIGDDPLVVFNITSSGQIQYTSSTYPGFSSLTMKFKMNTISI